MTYTTQRKEFLFISLFLLNKKNLAGARFKEGVNNKTNLYHLWYIATTLSPKKVTSMKQQPQYIHRTNLVEGVQLQRLNNGVWVYACEPM